MPWPTLLDAVFGVLTLAVIAATVLGVLRAQSWAERRATWSGPRVGARLVPQATAAAPGFVVFIMLPNIGGNAATPLGVFGFWPALMLLLAVAGISGVILGLARVMHWRKAHRVRS